MRHSFIPSGVCSQEILFDLDGDVVKNVEFIGGCPGNLRAISTLVDGMTVSEISGKLLGNRCGSRPTSCADQFARAILFAYEQEQAGK